MALRMAALISDLFILRLESDAVEPAQRSLERFDARVHGYQ